MLGKKTTKKDDKKMKVTNCRTNRKSRMNTSTSIVISGYYGLKAEKILCNKGLTIEKT